MTVNTHFSLMLLVIALISIEMYLTESVLLTLSVTCVLLLALCLYLLQYIHRQNSKAAKMHLEYSRAIARLDRYRLSLSALPEGVVLLRQGQTVEWCNASAERHLGLKLDRHLGIFINEAIPEPKIHQYLQSNDYSKPLKILSKEEGRELLLFAVVADKNHFIIVTHDVTEQSRLDNMRKDFVANVSHELRTPLTVLSGFLDMILMNPKIDRHVLCEQLTLMQEESSRMQNLVNDLLVLAGLENKDNLVEEEPDVISMKRLVIALGDDAQALSRHRHLIQTHIDTDLAVYGYVDEIRSACSNLVSNAVRYTPEGGSIDIFWHYDSESESGIYTVKDNGIGIAEKDIPRLTERFYRADKSRSRETGGTGLGLAIVKHVAIRNHCRLQIHSELGKGSSFSLIFPKETLVQ